MKLFDLGSTNSSYGESWTHKWCDNCFRDKYKCRTLMMAMGCGAQPELIYDENDEPVCTKYQHKDEHVVTHRPNPNQLEIPL